MPLHYDGAVKIHKIECGPYSNNAYLVICPKTRESIIIDTPAEPEKVLAEAKSTKVKAILITHNHSDHLAGFKEIRAATRAPVGIHREDAHALPSFPEVYLDDGDEIKAGTVTLKVMHTPGHTPGSVCLLTGIHLFTGDTLFPGGPGRSRTPENLQQMIRSITGKIYVLPDQTVVYPGHGADTDLQTSKEEYRIFSSRSHLPDLCGDVLWLSS